MMKSGLGASFQLYSEDSVVVFRGPQAVFFFQLNQGLFVCQPRRDLSRAGSASWPFFLIAASGRTKYTWI